MSRSLKPASTTFINHQGICSLQMSSIKITKHPFTQFGSIVLLCQSGCAHERLGSPELQTGLFKRYIFGANITNEQAIALKETTKSFFSLYLSIEANNLPSDARERIHNLTIMLDSRVCFEMYTGFGGKFNYFSPLTILCNAQKF